MEFIKEVIEYNRHLRQEFFTVTIGPQHGENDQMHFIYTLNDQQFELLIDFEPTDFSRWNLLQQWVGCLDDSPVH